MHSYKYSKVSRRVLACVLAFVCQWRAVDAGELTASKINIENDNYPTLKLEDSTLGFSMEISAISDFAHVGWLMFDQHNPSVLTSMRLRSQVSAFEGLSHLFEVSGGGTTAQGGRLGLFKLDAWPAHDQTETVRLDSEGSSWLNGGNVGIGTTTPGAKLEVNGDLKTVVSGNEVLAATGDGVRFGGGTPLKKVTSVVRNITFPNVNATSAATGTTSNVTDASPGDAVIITTDGSIPARVHVQGWVSSPGIVTVRLYNPGQSSISNPTYTFRIVLMKF